MTTAEKAGQITQTTLDVIPEGALYNGELPHHLDHVAFNDAILKYGTGSILNAPGTSLCINEWQEIFQTVQTMAMTNTHIGLPVLYGTDVSITPSVRRLKRFEKIHLSPEEATTTHFTLSKSDYAFVGKNNRWGCEPRTFTIKVGACSAEFQLS